MLKTKEQYVQTNPFRLYQLKFMEEPHIIIKYILIPLANALTINRKYFVEFE